jgi:hypothetical protein
MVEEAWLIHHLQEDHKPRQMGDKDGVGQQYVLLSSSQSLSNIDM